MAHMQCIKLEVMKWTHSPKQVEPVDSVQCALQECVCYLGLLRVTCIAKTVAAYTTTTLQTIWLAEQQLLQLLMNNTYHLHKQALLLAGKTTTSKLCCSDATKYMQPLLILKC